MQTQSVRVRERAIVGEARYKRKRRRRRIRGSRPRGIFKVESLSFLCVLVLPIDLRTRKLHGLLCSWMGLNLGFIWVKIYGSLLSRFPLEIV